MSLNGGDALARGAKSATFGGSYRLSNLEDDLIFRPDIVAEKYGITQEEVNKLQELRSSGGKLPILEPVVEEDATPAYFGVQPTKEIEEKPRKYPKKIFGKGKPLLDKVLIKRVEVDSNIVKTETGEYIDKRNGLIVPQQYRQHTNTGVVLAVGDFVVVGGVKTPLSEVVQPGDRVMYGDYNSELFHMEEVQQRELVDAIQMDFDQDFINDEETDLRIVRVQDIRVVEKPNV